MGYPDKPPASASRSDAATQAAWAALSADLRECGEIAGQRLSIALSQALRQAEASLFAASAESLDQIERDAILDAAELARARKDWLVADFCRHFEQRYVSACRRKPSVISCFRIDFDPGKLEIVKHDLLDDSLEPGKIEEAIKSASWATLQNLTNGFAALLGNQALKSSDIPLSPHLIEATLSDALRDQPWRHAAKHPLMRSLRGYLPEAVSQIYRDLTEHLLAITGLPGADEAEAEEVDIVQPSEVIPEAVCTIEPSPIPVPEADKKGAAVLDLQPTIPKSDRLPDPPTHAIGDFPLTEPVEPDLPAPCVTLPFHIEPARLPGPSQPADLPPGKPAKSANAVPPAMKIKPVLCPGINQALETTTHKSVHETIHEPVQLAACRTRVVNRENAAATVDLQPPLPNSDRLLAELAIGAWLEFRAADNTITLLKLAWISPRRNLYLLTNRQGQRALSMLAAELATAFTEGRARLAGQQTGCLSACPPARQHTNKTA